MDGWIDRTCKCATYVCVFVFIFSVLYVIVSVYYVLRLGRHTCCGFIATGGL
jgi:uncharacterized membrane protein YagU involved in acid resistance